MSIFRKGSVIVIVDKNENEPMEQFIERGNFIVKQNPRNDSEYEKYVLFSRIYMNIKYLGCEYDPNIMKEINVMKNI